MNIKSGDFASFEHKRSGDFVDNRIFQTSKTPYIILIFRQEASSSFPNFVTSDSFWKSKLFLTDGEQSILGKVRENNSLKSCKCPISIVYLHLISSEKCQAWHKS